MGNLQTTESKSHRKRHLLSSPKLQFPNLRYGQKQDDQIGNDSRGSIGNPSPNLINTPPGQISIPQLLHWYANEDEQKRDGKPPHHAKCPDDLCPALEIREIEDAVVHQEEGDLGPDEIPCVEDFGDQEELGHEDDVGGRDDGGVFAHSCPNHPENESYYNQVP